MRCVPKAVQRAGRESRGAQLKACGFRRDDEDKEMFAAGRQVRHQALAFGMIFQTMSLFSITLVKGADDGTAGPAPSGPVQCKLGRGACRIGSLLVLSLSLAACAGKPEAAILTPLAGPAASETAQRLDSLLPTEILLLGEQHDAAQHQQIEQWVISTLAGRGLLAALALEMADAGGTTSRLDPSSSEDQARAALQWNEAGWPWAAYGPAVMTAVRAGVPVLGANLPRVDMRASMADARLDSRLAAADLEAQQQLIRSGHCGMLPDSQILPMTRIQIARDMRMAETAAHAAVPGKVVLLITGSAHADRQLGVPRHVPPTVQLKSVRLLAGQPPADEAKAPYDAVWTTPALPPTDYCAQFKSQMAPSRSPAPAAPFN